MRLPVIAAVLVLCCPLAASPQSEPIVLHLASSPVDDVMPVLYAEQTGAFRKVGLDVQLTRMSSGSAVAAAVAGGSVDIGKSSTVAIVLAHVRGVPLVFVAPASMFTNPAQPDGALVVATSSPIQSARDLSGKVVAVPSLNDLNTVATKAWIDQNGGDSKTVQFVEVPVSAQIAALEAGRVQAGAMMKPFLGEATESGKNRILGDFYGAIAPRFMQSGWFATQDFAQKNAVAIANFQRVVAQASAYTNAHHDQTVALLAAWTGITPDEAARTPRMTTGERIQASDLQPVIDETAKYGLIPKPFNAREIIVDAPSR